MSGSKKFFKQSLTILLTLGASLLLGLLSFGGMYVLLPLLSVSIAAFVLSVIYEGEIYQKNITKALDKLIEPYFTEQLLGEEFLNTFNFKKRKLPSFFATYQKLSNQSSSPARDKRLKIMEIWLGQLLLNSQSESNYAKIIIAHLKLNEESSKKFQQRARQIQNHHHNIQIFAGSAAILMSLGTIFLILDVLPALPFLMIAPAVLPYVVIPMAAIAGLAYGFLSYNSLTDFLLKNSLQNWWQDIKEQLQNPKRNWKHVIFAVLSAAIFALNLALTLCTAGTWWTVVNATHTTWRWLKHPLTKILTALIAPVVSISTLGFNLENTIETINEVKEALEEKPQTQIHIHVTATTSKETWWQVFNPFRVILKLTFTPFLILFFLGHLISIGLTADRMPGVPAIVSALFGIISEGLEDFHYFFDLDKLLKPMAITFKIIASPFAAIGYLLNCLKNFEKPQLSHLSNIFSEGFQEAFVEQETTQNNCCATHHHEHSALPDQILELVFSPIIALSALWHWGFQDKTLKNKKSYWECYNLQLGKKPIDERLDFQQIQTITDSGWLSAEAQFEIQEHLAYLNQQTQDQENINAKTMVFKKLHHQLNPQKSTSFTTQNIIVKNEITTHLDKDIIRKQRSFFRTEKTSSEHCLEHIQNLLTSVPPCSAALQNLISTQ